MKKPHKIVRLFHYKRAMCNLAFQFKINKPVNPKNNYNFEIKDNPPVVATSPVEL